jgi:hypothetical protein
MPVASQPEVWVCDRTLAGIAGPNPAKSVMCCQVEISASGRSFVQRDPTLCGVSECDCEVSIMRKLWSTGGCSAMGKSYVCLFTFRIVRSNVQCRPSNWTAHTNNCDMPLLETYALLGLFLL